MKLYWKIILASLISSVLTSFFFIFILKFAFSYNFFTLPNKTIKTFQTEGTGQISAVPNTAEMNFGVTNTSFSVVEAQKLTNQTISKILNDLKSLKIDPKNIKTSNYSIYPQYSYVSNSQVPSAYSVTQNITLKIMPIDKAGQVIDIATKNGANMLGTVTFVFSNKLQNNLEEKARIMAIDEAKQKAYAMTKETGIKLGKIINVEEVNSNNFPFPRPVIMPMMNQDSKLNNTQLPPGETTISKKIKITFEIE